MANLTIAIDADVLKRARIRAINEGSTVNKLLREFLESYVNDKERQMKAVRNLIALSKKSKARSDGRRWTREELHDRRL